MRFKAGLFSAVLLVFTFTVIAVRGDEQSVVPKVFLDFWNTADVRPKNNCYNYATNRRTDNYAQPGHASHQKYTALTCANVYEAAGKDLGLVPAEFFSFNGKNDYLLVALVVAPNYDFHWYRRGDDNMWTHKPGGTAATSLDSNGKVITSPETAARGPYKDFCGYFRLKNYVKQPDEQNGGYVRIGNMTDLPPTLLLARAGQSTVEMLIYSGRADPVIKLRDLMPYFNIPELRQLADTMKSHQIVGDKIPNLPPSFSKLGYRGLQIVDRQGLLFPRGTAFLIRGEYIFFVFDNSREIRWRRIPKLVNLERGLLSEFHKTAKIPN